MTGFIEQNLNPNEKIVYRAIVHWFIYVESFLWLFVALGVFLFGNYALGLRTSFLFVICCLILLIAAKKFIDAFMHKYCTEMAITNRRIIAKFGFIRRDVIELPLEKIESVVIDQSVIERLTDAGSIAVRGTGAAMAPVRFIDKPIEFRNQLNIAIASAKQGGSGE